MLLHCNFLGPPSQAAALESLKIDVLSYHLQTSCNLATRKAFFQLLQQYNLTEMDVKEIKNAEYFTHFNRGHIIPSKKVLSIVSLFQDSLSFHNCFFFFNARNVTFLC